MRLFRVIVPVTDITRAVRFYRTILRRDGRRVSPGQHYFDCEGTILACQDVRADGEIGTRAPLSEPLCFVVDELEALYEEVRAAGATAASVVACSGGQSDAIALRPWGEVSFYVFDPFGNALCFVLRESVFTGESTPTSK